ncbi:AraC family transcriptional regulator [uncultured Thiodictyon sp.]|uniref:AraC family transcriptional regulator n=1 Tax=uncultured Thiodictyon sp. TaxID=1846217 RepID=UPI0025D8335C|nr:AraC family transcriptional regulator [uncultured Thiodictyon sp.]
MTQQDTDTPGGPLPEPLPAGQTLVGEGNLRMAPLLVLPTLLAELGLAAAPIIGAAGIDLALFDDAENTISFQDLGRLLATCAEQTACPHLGLLMGRQSGLSVLGGLAPLARSAPDLGRGLRTMIRYLHLHDQGAVPTLWEDGDTAMLGYVIHLPDVPATMQIYDAAVAITYNILKELAGRTWEASEVRLHRPPPTDLRPYRGHFRTRLRFGTEHSAVVFDAAWLRRPLEGADAAVHRQALREAEALDAAVDTGLAGRVRRVLRGLVVGGAGLEGTSLESVAKLFALHRRTLNRRLRDQGTSFKSLIEETRYEIARQLLRDTRLPLLEVALTLGYSDVTAFTRAFRRWSGTCPSDWRVKHRQP